MYNKDKFIHKKTWQAEPDKIRRENRAGACEHSNTKQKALDCRAMH